MSARGGGISHWDEVPPRPYEHGDLRATRLRIGPRAGASVVGLSRFLIPPGCRSMPVHVHADEEEIFHVLTGDGFAYIGDQSFAIGPGDTLVHPAGGRPHTILAGGSDLDVLVFASGSPTNLTYLARPQLFWAGPHWIPAASEHPFKAEAACGPLVLPEPTVERPATIVALADVAPDQHQREGYRGSWRDLASPGGSVQSGLRHVTLDAGQMSAPPHWHSCEEELFVILGGTGELLLMENDLTETRTPLIPGNVVARPSATGVAHALIAAEAGLTFLAYGLRDAGEIVYYPRSRKAYLGPLLVRVEPVADYWDGEP